jgi:uncharacterized YkwD family protein
MEEEKMKKNWRNKIIALLAIAVIAVAFAAPVNALNIASDCNNANATSCNSILNALGVCPSKTDTNVCGSCPLTNAQTAASVNNSQKESVQTVNNNTANTQSSNNYWTQFLNSIKQNNNVITNPAPTASAAKPAATTNGNTSAAAQTATTAATVKPTNSTNTGASAAAQTTTAATAQSGLTAQEQQMVNLVNSEREKAGLKPLAVDTKLSQMARVKSQDMADNNYFSHTSPTYGSPFDMMKTFGITYKTAGENIALNSSVEKAHVALMNSEGHRANILNPNFTHIGIGIVSKGGNLYITQDFIGK